MSVDYKELVNKYNVPVPRYTSFPTVPFWNGVSPVKEKWEDAVAFRFSKSNNTTGISLYIHLPYCEQMCTYCACSRVITKDHSVEESYTSALIAEWDRYVKLFADRPILRELHLGGGTPTFFSKESLDRLLSSILGSATLHEDHSFSFEAHPNNTTEEHLKTLYNFGFRRVSLGVQDFDLEVQKRINRVQSFETVERVSLLARDMGYSSLNFDLIYGLPSQQPSSISGTLKHVETLMPDRIALYSYAHVPWKEKGQRGFTEDEIPQGEEKRALYELAKDGLLKLGYMDIGMDHFSLPTDSLYRAKVEKRLHRNFMGYNTSQSSLLIGLGASSISDAGNAYAQNTKDIEAYKESMLNSDEWNHTNGVFLTDDDIVLKSAILSISCHGELVLDSRIKDILGVDLMHSLQEMENEGLIKTQKDSFSLTEIGTVFLRNVCSLFDPYFKGSMSSIGKKEDGKDKNRFSKAL